MSSNFLLGMNAVLYYDTNIGTAAVGVSAMTTLTNIRDNSLTLDAGEADVTTRGNSGWRATAATLREATADFEMLWLTGDAGFEAFRDAYLANGEIHLAILDQVYTTTGAQGLKGDFTVTSFTRSEPLEEAETVSVTVKLSSFSEWYETP